jgi:hypothetical protein
MLSTANAPSNLGLTRHHSVKHRDVRIALSLSHLPKNFFSAPILRPSFNPLII